MQNDKKMVYALRRTPKSYSSESTTIEMESSANLSFVEGTLHKEFMFSYYACQDLSLSDAVVFGDETYIVTKH